MNQLPELSPEDIAASQDSSNPKHKNAVGQLAALIVLAHMEAAQSGDGTESFQAHSIDMGKLLSTVLLGVVLAARGYQDPMSASADLAAFLQGFLQIWAKPSGAPAASSSPVSAPAPMAVSSVGPATAIPYTPPA